VEYGYENSNKESPGERGVNVTGYVENRAVWALTTTTHFANIQNIRSVGVEDGFVKPLCKEKTNGKMVKRKEKTQNWRRG